MKKEGNEGRSSKQTWINSVGASVITMDTYARLLQTPVEACDWQA